MASQPYTVPLDADAARAAAAAGAALLLLDVPPGTVVGVDHQVRERGREARFARQKPGLWQLATCSASLTHTSFHRHPPTILPKPFPPTTPSPLSPAPSFAASR